MNYEVVTRRLLVVLLAVMLFVIYTKARVSYEDIQSFIYSTTGMTRSILIGLSFGVPAGFLGWVINGFTSHR